MWTPWSVWSWWIEALNSAKLEPNSDEDPPEDRVNPDPEDTEDGQSEDEPEDEPWALRSVGCWVGFGSFVKNSSIDRDLAFAKRLGLGRLDVIVNDHSASRSPRHFGTYNKSRITAFCQRAVEEGFSVHLMTWCMPPSDEL